MGLLLSCLCARDDSDGMELECVQEPTVSAAAGAPAVLAEPEVISVLPAAETNADWEYLEQYLAAEFEICE